MVIPPYDPPDVTAPVWTLGDRMRKARETAGYGHTAMAEYFGVHRNQITRWESGRTPPKRHIVVQWALVTKVPLVWLETGAVPVRPDGEPGETPRKPRRTKDGAQGDFRCSTPSPEPRIRRRTAA